ncbi:MAG: 3-isopropylmalate dehydrogenase [Armatimonadetes bacterium]|nr:3-isopropylmalate dehydrogenase [Armatimonadota bacterium]
MRATVAVLPGDGIGPEVTAEAVRALRRIAELYGHELEFREALLGGCAIESQRDPLPEETLRVCRESEAILMGAVGGPRWSDPTAGVRPEQGLLRLRSTFELFANLRPVRAWPGVSERSPVRAPEVDLLFVRELTSGIYFGPRHEQDENGVAWDTMKYTVEEVERVARVAFQAARGRRGRVASVDKANVLAASRLWRRTVDRVAREFPDVLLEHVLVDACAMHLLTRPASFDVVLASNLFGDILSDEASVLAGSLGMLPSASLGKTPFGLYEPVHGSAPDIAGQGIANPVGALLSAAMLLRHSLGLETEAGALEGAVEETLAAGARTRDVAEPTKSALGTREFADRVLARLTPVAVGE